MDLDINDFYIGYKEHPKFIINKIIEDDLIRVIVQKYEMIIFTNKGDLYGDLNFGADLPRMLHQTRVSAAAVKKDILNQIFTYIPEISDINFILDVDFYQDPNNYQDYMEILFQIKDYEIYSIIN